ncbi:MAG: sensor histidine kinase [Acidobacteria bacterium]|nr:sensor histidine kinase [Acidobacteriota bacterium]
MASVGGVKTEFLETESSKRQSRAARLALSRAFLAVAYAVAEMFFSTTGPTLLTGAVIGVFVAYSILLLFYHSHRSLQNFSLLILLLDLLFLLWLGFWRTNVYVALAAMSYVFLVLESITLHGAREVVLIATAVTLVFYAGRAQEARAQPLVLTVNSTVFLLVVGGLLAFLSTDQRYGVERRIHNIADLSVGASAEATVAAMQEALKHLAEWFRCSHALLVFWDQRWDYFSLCRYPPSGGTSRPAPAELEESREWSICRGTRLDFVAEQIPSAEGNQITPPSGFDLHPRLIRKFHITNAIGCGLYYEGKAVGRLLLVNRVSPVRPYLLRRLKRVSPAFTRLALLVLVIKSVEHAAYERERHRLAQDFHDGPLQSIISFQMRTHLIRKLLDKDPAAAAQELEQLQELARKQVTEMRSFVSSMRPVEIDTSSVTAAARRLVDDFQKESGVSVTFMSGGEPVSAPGKIGVDILQIIREALTNIQKHDQATHVLFSLEKGNNTLTISVNDNGKGFRFGGKYTLEELELLRLGPNSIKQRLRALGGDVLLESQPGHGASLRLKIPLY